ncbi:MAG: hypothetical protein II558_11655, partial [Treponema sp.]|nr:hypothetical protein [Treponema sp.]
EITAFKLFFIRASFAFYFKRYINYNRCFYRFQENVMKFMNFSHVKPSRDCRGGVAVAKQWRRKPEPRKARNNGNPEGTVKI